MTETDEIDGGVWSTQPIPQKLWGYNPTGGPADTLIAARCLAGANWEMINRLWTTQAQIENPEDGIWSDDMASVYSNEFRRKILDDKEAARVYMSDFVAEMVLDLASSLPPVSYREALAGFPKSGVLMFKTPIVDPVTADQPQPTYNCGFGWATITVTVTGSEDANKELADYIWIWRLVSAAAVNSEPAYVAASFNSPLFPLAPTGLLVDLMPSPDGDSKLNLNHDTLFYARVLVAVAHWSKTMASSVDGISRPEQRALQRAATKEQKSGRSGTVNYYRLRRLEQVESDPTETGGSDGVDWSCRWVVNPHWRNQPCGPGNYDRRLTLIPPHIKGPLGKPIRYKDRVIVLDR